MSKKVKKQWQGLSPHRYKNNPLEKAAALAWQEANKERATAPSLIDYLMDKENRGRRRATDEERLTAATVIQWLGSPVGIHFVDQVFGDEIMRIRKQKGVLDTLPEKTRVIEPGQVYVDRDKRMKGRKLTVLDECKRHGRTHLHDRWLCESSTTGRKTWLKAEHLLNPARFKQEG